MFFHLIQELQRAIALEIPGTEAERSVTSSSSRRRMMTLPPSGFGLCTCPATQLGGANGDVVQHISWELHR